MAMRSGKGARWALVPFVLLTFLECQVALRVADDDEMDAEIDGELVVAEQCTEALRTVHRNFNYAKLFNPIFDGTYKIRNRASGKYLTGTKDGDLGTALHQVDTNCMHWKLKRVTLAGMPVYTLQNEDSGRTLSGHDGKVFSVRTKQKKAPGWNPFKRAPLGEFAHWQLNLGPDGVHYAIGTGKDADQVMAPCEDGLVELVKQSGQIEEWRNDEWFLEKQESFLRRPRTNKGGYVAQWPVAGNMPVWAGTNYTFFQMTKDAKFKGAEAYAALRKTYKIFSKVAETERRIVLANYVTKCDAPTAMLTGFGFGLKLLQAMRATTGEACKELSLLNISIAFKEVASEACFDECIAAAEEETKDLPCRKPDNVTALLERIVSLPACGTLPASTVEKLSEQVLMARCMKYAKPNLLYSQEINFVAAADGNPFCSVDSKSRSARDIKTLRQCYSGTTCQCPRTYLRTPKSYAALRYKGDLMVPSGSGNLVTLLRGRITSAGRSAAIRVVFRGMTVAAAVKSLPLSPSFLPIAAWSIFKWVRIAAKWRCAQSLNCWPVQPKRQREAKTRKACRLPEEARKGGSKVWFLPPPGIMVRNKKGVRAIFGRCELTSCEARDMMRERVGFGPAGPQAEAAMTLVNGTKNSVGCPSSSRPLTLTECKAAAAQYGYTHLRDSALSSFPAGCFLYHGHGVYWNTNAAGKAQADSANVCKEKVSKASGGSPNIYNCQRMKFEEMTDEQQQLFLQDVRRTLPAEYEDEL